MTFYTANAKQAVRRLLRGGLTTSRQRPGFYSLTAVFAVIILGSISCLMYAQDQKPSEYEVESAYLYNFGKFVVWPAASVVSRGNFAICVLDNDPLGPVMESTLTGKVLGGIPVVIRRIPKPQDAASCRILFIGSSNEDRLKDILAALDHAPVLTVSDIADFSKRGGMIEFLMKGNYIRFAINRTTAEDAGLVLDSDLLKVAIAVWQSGGRGGR